MLELLAYIVLFFTGIQLIVAVVNWWADERLPRKGSDALPSVSVLIPARNEAHNIGTLLDDLLRLQPAPAEIIVCDDHSTDGTAALVQQYAATHPTVRLFPSGRLPLRWTGKNHACYQLAAQASGEYLLFLDADVRVRGTAVSRALTVARRYGLGLLTVFPRQLMHTWGEWLVVPLMNYILLTLLPLVTVRKVPSQQALAAANGQFMLFRADTYRRLQPHKRVRRQPVEDIQIARYYKGEGVLVGCFTGDAEVACRMYHGFREAVNGFSRSLPSFFGDSFLTALLFWGVTTLGGILVGLAFPGWVLAGYIIAYLLTRIVVSLVSRQHLLYNVLLSPFQQLCLGWIILRAAVVRSMRRQYWKGRKIG